MENREVTLKSVRPAIISGVLGALCLALLIACNNGSGGDSSSDSKSRTFRGTLVSSDASALGNVEVCYAASTSTSVSRGDVSVSTSGGSSDVTAGDVNVSTDGNGSVSVSTRSATAKAFNEMNECAVVAVTADDGSVEFKADVKSGEKGYLIFNLPDIGAVDYHLPEVTSDTEEITFSAAATGDGSISVTVELVKATPTPTPEATATPEVTPTPTATETPGGGTTSSTTTTTVPTSSTTTTTVPTSSTTTTTVPTSSTTTTTTSTTTTTVPTVDPGIARGKQYASANCNVGGVCHSSTFPNGKLSQPTNTSEFNSKFNGQPLHAGFSLSSSQISDLIAYYNSI